MNQLSKTEKDYSLKFPWWGCMPGAGSFYSFSWCLLQVLDIMEPLVSFPLVCAPTRVLGSKSDELWHMLELVGAWIFLASHFWDMWEAEHCAVSTCATILRLLLSIYALNTFYRFNIGSCINLERLQKQGEMHGMFLFRNMKTNGNLVSFTMITTIGSTESPISYVLFTISFFCPLEKNQKRLSSSVVFETVQQVLWITPLLNLIRYELLSPH